MNLTTAQMKKGNVVLPKYRALYMDVLLQEVRGIRYSREKEFKRLVRDMKTVEEMECDIPEEIDSVLREYQRTGVAWLNTLYHNGFSGILADDMGLGKTLQTIAFLAMLWRDQQEKESKVDALALVVTPASLVYNWENELQKFAPHLPVRLMIGKQDVRLQLLQEIQKDEIVITSYDLLKRDIDSYQNLTFACQVIDEAQNIKNHTTQAAKAVKVVQAGFHIALTGTPIENRLSELWSIFDFLMPGFLYSYKKFREKWEIPVVQNQEKEVAERLQKMISPFLLRRLKKDVLQDLPDKLEEDYYAQLEGEQQKLYDAHVKRIQLVLQTSSDQEFKKSKLQILSELTKLRQICCDPALLYSDYRQGSAKLEMCMELLRNAVNGGHKILLFSQFTTMLDRIAERLKEEKISYFMLTGATDKRKRKEMVESFNKDATSVFCISLKAGGTGLNLTAADIVIHYDPWWNEAVQNQATDRAHRIGQQNVVNVYRLISKGTIEEKIVKLQEQKKALADQILSGDGFSQSNFSKEELLELLGGEE
jgi:SNF2 family DNA or RNA helicase